jgi:PAS domain S-box-containing protein
MKEEMTIKQLLEENKELRIRLVEAEDTIHAITEGGIDALVVHGIEGEHVFTLSGEDVIYRRLVETMNEAGLTTTPEGTILFCNQRFSRSVHVPIEEIVGRPLERFVHSSSHQNLADLFKTAEAGPCTGRLVFHASDGTLVPTYTSANLLVQGDSVSVCLVAADLTDLEATEETLRQINEHRLALRQANDQLEERVKQRTEELDAKNIELRKRADQLARLVSELTLTEQRERHRLAKVLHDHLQQLLVGAKLGLVTLRCQVTDDQHQTAVDEVFELIRESIAASRSLTVELSPTILHDAGLTAGIEWLVRWIEQKHSLVVELETQENVTTDREDIRILLFESVRELLLNVVKHSGATRAKVGLSRFDDYIEITVSDEGVGFDPEHIDDRAVGKASGFGLFSIRERLELIGGRLNVESAPQQGTRFTLTAPCKTQMAEEPLTADLRPLPVKVETHNIRVMVTDDHAVVRQGLCNLLQREVDMDVVGQASDGQQAVEMSRQLKPDVILMDYSMPKMDGVAATKAIHAQLPDIKIIGLSMYSEADRAMAMLEVGATAYVDKSGEFSSLVETIRYSVSTKQG